MTGHISSYFVGVTGGLTMSFIAFSIVFIVIVGLMLVMMGMKHVCAAIDNMSKPKPATTAQPSPAPAAPAPAAPAAAVSADDDELLAVISAAIMAACGSTARVVAFSPVKAPVSTAWKNVGRLQNTEGC
ncbi:OadG family protein [Cloacibacillus porcorum]|uniref:Uncharacterized protein n=1 Tax=Cloacibacillus porcorum TaxID=1197717 RepID=A0A1B2I330_9BACT|nr:OadG family protein [Cloacibacillus porcorum]ANZ44376.1 hypothetical protein BED41_04300 [Cloacibacillus porcorum]